MAHGHPDFWTASVVNMPSIGEGQVAWFQSDTHLVPLTGTWDLINYVVPDDLELHVCSGVISCDFPRTQRYDLRQTPAASWISPTSHIDADDKWLTEENAYDGNVNTFAYEGVEPSSWGSYLELLVNEQNIDKVKFNAYYSASHISKIDVDVYYDGAWHDVYEGAYPSYTWVEKSIPAGVSLVSKARVRFYNPTARLSLAAFAEFMFNTSGTTSQEGIYFDTHAVIPYLPQAPYLVEAGATFAVRVYNDDDAAHNMSVGLAGFLQKKV